MLTKAVIHEVEDGTSYHVTCEAECRDETDLSAYRSAVELQDIVTMDKTVVELYK